MIVESSVKTAAKKKLSLKSAIQSRGILSPEKAETVLKELANLPGEIGDLITDRDALDTHAPETARLRRAHQHAVDGIKRLQDHYSEAFEYVGPVAILTLRDLLRKAWTAQNPRHAEWFLFRFRTLAANTMRREREVRDAARSSAGLSPETPSDIPATFEEAKRFIQQSEPPPVSHLEAASVFLATNLRRTLYCPNGECVTPYNFRTKMGQKFCSPECARPSRLESQRRWWHQHGKGAKKRGKKK